jgi:mannan endo-1,4-beta-mannosidase
MSLKIRWIFFTAIVLAAQTTDAQRFEAEVAVLAGGAIKQTSAARSGGQYVSQNEGSLTFTVTLPAEGFFNILIYAAAPHGNKINVFSVNENTIDFATTTLDYTSLKIVSGLKLPAGNHTLKISKSWGYIDIDYIELQKVSSSGRFAINPTLVTPDPNDGAARLYQFLYDHYGKKIISGVMTLNSFDETNWLKTNVGKEPALIGLDFMHSGRGYTWYNDRQPIEDARTFYNRNGIPAICWHWRDPSRATEEFYTNKTTFDVNSIFDETSAGYQRMISDIDYIAGLLKELQNENIPVIWRPLHEAAGGWFWWGAKGAAPCKKLYQVMYDRMVSHHGLKNLIWVWTREPNDDEWYPGDAYVDIVGRDIYKEGNHGSHILEWSDMNERYGQKKMATVSECGSFPDADNLIKDGAAWSWFMPWYGTFVRDSKYNTLAMWGEALNHEYVITLDEMPNLKTYEAAAPDPDPVLGTERPEAVPVKIYPAPVDDQLYLESSSIIGRVRILNSLGKAVVETEMPSSKGNISFSGLRAGLYFIKIGNHPTGKIIKK